MASSIPSRSSSRYAGQYSGTIDAQRMLEIFTDSLKIALSSKNPETAILRYELAIEAYHQAVSMPLPAETRASLNDSMNRLAESFPAQVLVNEAVGLSEKAAKLKTPKKRIDLLQRAVTVVEAGLRTFPQNPQLRAVHEVLRAEAAKAAGSVPV
jgi:hypothetical protein